MGVMLTKPVKNQHIIHHSFLPTMSIIMPCYLGEYNGSATNKDKKFLRAVDSVLNQRFTNWELIIVSDGCDLTEKLYRENFYPNTKIKFKKIDKQPLFSGNVRETGLIEAMGEYVTYLDCDDFWGEGHLERINGAKYGYNILYWNDFVYFGIDKEMKEELIQSRETELKSGKIGTSCFAHRNEFFNGFVPTWLGCNGYGHDWTFFKRMFAECEPHKINKVYNCEYYVCHVKHLNIDA